MSKIILCLLLFFVVSTADTHAGRSLYVAPNGADTNTGTQTAPWKSFYKAAQSAIADDTVIFADGAYTETKQAIVANSGTATAPIVFKSQNKWGAKVIYTTAGIIIGGQPFKNHPKILNQDKDYITIQDFEITSTEYGDMTAGANLIRCWIGADYCSIIGNKLHGTTEVIKASTNKSLLVDGNEIYNTTWGTGITGGDSPIFRNNNVYNFKENAFQTKMNTRNAQIYNNYVHSGTTAGTDIAITLGGATTCAATDGCTNMWDSGASGWEGWGSVAYNNVVATDPGGSIAIGIGMQGCYKCGAFNNTIIGTSTALYSGNSGGIAAGWTHATPSTDPIYKNNIIKGCSTGFSTKNGAGLAGIATLTNNLFNNCPTPAGTTNTITTDPLLMSATDFHLQANSPAIGKGIIATFINNAGISIDMSKDKDGKIRISPWDLGAYQKTSTHGDVNKDNLIDLLDFNIWRDEFIGTRTTKTADLNLDTKIDLLDFNIWLKSYQNT